MPSPLEINSKLERGDLRTIAKITGYHFEYVGQIMREEAKLLPENKKIVDCALSIIDTREQYKKKLAKLIKG